MVPLISPVNVPLTPLTSPVNIPFVALTLFFGTKNGYYDSYDYTGDGCAHDVKR